MLWLATCFALLFGASGAEAFNVASLYAEAAETVASLTWSKKRTTAPVTHVPSALIEIGASLKDGDVSTAGGYKYILFQPTKVRGFLEQKGIGTKLQLAEIKLRGNGADLKPQKAENQPGASSPGNEGPEKAIDGDTRTKWLVNDLKGLILTFSSAVLPDQATYVTANDVPGRDVLQFSVLGSMDKTSWKSIFTTNLGEQVPNARHTQVPWPPRASVGGSTSSTRRRRRRRRRRRSSGVRRRRRRSAQPTPKQTTITTTTTKKVVIGPSKPIKPVGPEKSQEKCASYTVSCPFCDCQNPGPIYSTPAPGMKPWESYFLDAHNKVRCLHGIPPMRWNKDIAKKAQDWANQEGPRYTRGKNPHSSSGFRQNVAGHSMLGENIAWQSRPSGYQAPETKAVYAWYEEIKDTDNGRVRQGNTIPQRPMIGHYTQLAWEGSVELGCGEYKQPNNGYGFFVCQYGPMGNMQGQVVANVHKIKVSPSKCSDPRSWAKKGGSTTGGDTQDGQGKGKDGDTQDGQGTGGGTSKGTFMVKHQRTKKCLKQPDKGNRLTWENCNSNDSLMRWKKIKGTESLNLKDSPNHMYLINALKNTCLRKYQWLRSCGDYSAEGRGQHGQECARIEGSDRNPSNTKGLLIFNTKHRVFLGSKSQEGNKAVFTRNDRQKVDFV